VDIDDDVAASAEGGVIGDISVLPDTDTLARAAAEIFVATAAAAVRLRGTFRVALAGGGTPKAVYALLAGDERLRSRVEWNRVQVFWGDERHVPPDHGDSNFRMADEAMLRRVAIDSRHVWRIKGERADADRAAREYERDLHVAFELGARQPPRFDLVLLGMGPDGHTASLFPGTDALYERTRFVVANRVEPFHTDRITLTVPVINNAAEIVFIVQGADKAAALREVLEGPFDPDRLPAQFIHPTRGRLRWLVDPSAAALLSVTTDVGECS